MQNIGNTVLHYDEVTSTNDVARNLYHEGVAGHGTLIVAAHQSKGRGQEQTVWESAAGQNLLCSLILEPVFLRADQQVWLNLAICNAFRAFANQQIQDTVYIKWPNDIYLQNLKLGGILIENGLQQEWMRYSIIGLGMNINQENFGLLPAISLKNIDGEERTVSALLPALCNELNTSFELLKNGQTETILATYLAYFWKKNEYTGFVRDGVNFTGLVKGIDPIGRLILDINGTESIFQHKEIEWLH